MGNYGSRFVTGRTGEYDNAGSSVTGIGDFNGDGIDDFAVAARRAEGYNYSQTGAVYIVYGTEGGDLEFSLDDIDGSNGFMIGPDPVHSDYSYNTSFGSKVVGLGDVNGDGNDDFGIVQNATSYYGNYGYNGNYGTEGVAYVVYGGQTVEDAEIAVTELSHFRMDAYGEITDIVNLGDVNGDGFNDTGVVSQERDPDGGIYTETTVLFDYDGNGTYDEGTNDFFNYYSSYAAVSDVTAYVVYGTDQARTDDNPIAEDGNSDVIVNLETLSTGDGFAVALGQVVSEVGNNYYEGEVSLSSSIGSSGNSLNGSYDYGVGLAGSVDIDGDGFRDLIVRSGGVGGYNGSNYYVVDRSGGGGGGYYGFYGGINSAYTNVYAPQIISGQNGDSAFVNSRPGNDKDSLAGLGSFFGDGAAEALAIAGFATDDLNGISDSRWGVFVLPGNADFFDSTSHTLRETEVNNGDGAFFYSSETYVFNGETRNTVGGIEGVLNAGDVNGDGYDEMLVLARAFDPSQGSHYRGYLVSGSDTAQSGAIDLDQLVTDGDAYRFDGESIAEIRVAAVGDVDNDGNADLIIGEPNSENGNGSATIVHGGSDALEAADNADGADDNIIAHDNLKVDVDTGLVPIDVFMQTSYAGSFAEGDDGVTEVAFVVERNGNLNFDVSVDWEVSPGGLTTFYDDANASDFEGGVLPSGTVTFVAGENTATILIPIQGDLISENNFEDFQVVLTDASSTDNVPVAVGDLDRTGAYIQNDDTPATISINNTGVTEGDPGDDSVMVFTVYRSGETDSTVTVDWTATQYTPSIGISVENEDIEGGLPQSGTVTFAPNETTATIELPIVEDDIVEGTEYLLVDLSNATNDGDNGVTISDGQAYGYITDDDFPAQYAVNNPTVTESDDVEVTLSFTITRSGDTEGTGSVDYQLNTGSASEDDFASGYIDPNTGDLVSGTVTFADGETTKTVDLQVVGDQIDENTESVRLDLSNPTSTSANGATIIDSSGFGYIYDDDFSHEFSVSNASVTEGQSGAESNLTFTVYRSGLTVGEATVDFSLEAYTSQTADADDFASGFPQSGTLTFADGETSKTVTAVVSDDDDVESTEYVQLLLSNPAATNGEEAKITDANGFGYIYNDDIPVIFSASGVTIDEGDEGETTNMVFTVSRSGETGVAATLDYSVQPYLSSQAADDDDFVGALASTGTVSFAAGVTSQQITVEIQGDGVQEANEFFQIFFSNPTATGASTQLNTGSVFGTIRNDDVPTTYSTSAATVVEGQSGGLTPLTFTITRSGDTGVAGTVDYALTAYAAGPSITAESADFENGLPQSGTVSFAAGETFKQVTFNVKDDEVYEQTEYATLTLSNPTADDNSLGAQLGNSQALAYIYDDEIPVYFGVQSDSVTEGDEGDTTTLSFRVYRSGDTNQVASVDYSVSSYYYSGADDDDLAESLPLPIGGSLSFAAGETEKFVEIDVAGDDVFEGTEYLQIDLSNADADNAAVTAVIQNSRAYGYIYDDDTPTYFRVYGYSTTEGDTGDNQDLTFIVSRFGDVTGEAEVDYNIAGGNVNAADFESGAWPAAGTLSFGAGISSITVTIPIAGDEEIEGDEYTYMTLSNPVSLTDGIDAQISTGSASAVIRNDDLPAYLSVSSWASATEGDEASDNTSLNFTVTRSGDTTSSVSVEYDFVADSYTPVSSADFEGGLPQNGTVTFAAGERTKTISFAIAEDEDIETNERGILTLSDAAVVSGDADASVEITRATSVGVIYNDDQPPCIQVLVNGSQWGTSVNEGNSGFTDVTVSFIRDGNLSGELTIDYALLTQQGSVFAADSNDIDGFLPASGQSVTFADGVGTATATIRINGDGIIEANESFSIAVQGFESSDNIDYTVKNPNTFVSIRNDDGRPPIPELPIDDDGDGIPDRFIRVEADVFGDPHIVTLDGLGYDFQAVGEYVLVETLDPDSDTAFSVQVRFEAFPGSDLVSVTTKMAVEVKGKTIEVDALSEDGTLFVDGVAVDLDEIALSGFDLDSDTTNANDIFAEDGKIFIQLNDIGELLMIGVMDGSLNVCVFLNPNEGGNAGAVRGLMGNANGDLTDDFEMRDGSEIPEDAISYDDDGTPALDFNFVYGFGEYEGAGYRDSWAVDSGERLFNDTTPDFPENFPAGPVNFDDLPASVRAAASLAADEAGITDPVLREAAILDFALTGDDGFVQGATQLAADPEASSETTENPDSAPAVGVAADAVSVVEGDSGVQEVTYTFYRTGDVGGTLEVGYEVIGQINDDDLGTDTPRNGTVSFADGETEQSLTVLVKGDLTTELNETLIVRITGTDNEAVLVSGSQGSTKILTDDFGPAAEDDNLDGDAGSTISGNLLDDNGQGEDTDDDDDTLTVTQVIFNNEPFDIADGPFDFGFGWVLTVDSDGNFQFDTGSAYDGLAVGSIETFSFEYEVSDGNGGTDTASVTLAIAGTSESNADPIAENDEATTDEDTPVYIDILGNDEDPDGDNLTVVLGDPANGSVEFDGTGYLYTPDQDFNGTDSFTYTISDGKGGEDTAQVDITVTPINDGPVAVDDAEELAANANRSLNVLSGVNGGNADVDVDGDGLSVLRLLDANGDEFSINADHDLIDGGRIVVTSGGRVTFITNGAFDALGAGESADVNFSYVVSDGEATDIGAVTLTVNGVNDAPEVSDAASETDEDTQLNLDLAINAFDVDGDDLTFRLLGEASNGDVEISASGLMTYTPDDDFFGADSFTYEVDDGNGGVTEASFDITVNPINDAPVASNSSASIDEDDSGSIDLLPLISDIDGDALEIASLSVTAGATVVQTSDTEFTITGDPDFYGPVTVTYSVTDGELTSNEATINVAVNSVNDAPVLGAIGPFSVDENTTDVGTITATDVDFMDLSFSIVGGAEGALFSISETGELSFDAAPDFEAPADDGGDNVYEVQVEVSDGDLTDDAFVYVTVNDVDEDPGVNEVLGTDGNDRLTGTEGADLFLSGAGRADVMTGLGGADVFDFSDSVDNGTRETRRITDFNVDEDVIVLDGAAGVSATREIRGDTYVFLDGDRDVIILEDVSDFDTDSFL